jgi:hypothetical protein
MDRISRPTAIQIVVLAGLVSCLSVTPLHTAKGCTANIQCTRSNCNGNICCNQPPELWLINTRCAPRCHHLDEGMNCLNFQRYDRLCGRWVDETLGSFLASEASAPSLFYVHGNGKNHEIAMRACGLLYDQLCRCPGPKRLVMWSWPSERVFVGLRLREVVLSNLRIKYDYAEFQGYYLANVVQQMSLSQRVTLLGHSYGGVAVATALHLLGGGCLDDLVLEGGAPVERANLRGGILAGAMDHDVLYPGCRYGQALVSAELVWTSCNPGDRVLRHWNRVSPRSCPALGCVGVQRQRLGELGCKSIQQPVFPEIHQRHKFDAYMDNPGIVSAICCLAFADSQFAPTTAAAADR